MLLDVFTNFYSIEFIILGFVLVFVFSMIIVSVVKSIKRNRVIKNGNKKIAKHSSTYKGRLVNKTVNNKVVSSTQYYGINYEYKNENGEIKKVKSPDSYTLFEVQKFEQSTYFEIRVLDGHAEIPHVPTSNDIKKFSYYKTHKTCSYCKSSINKDVFKCENCGSSKFDEII